LDRWSLGSNDLVQEVEWEAVSDVSDTLMLIPAGGEYRITCHVIGTVLFEDFHMGPNGDLDLASTQAVLEQAAYAMCIGPPAPVHTHPYGPQLLAYFRRAIRNSTQLSCTADDAGLGRGKSDVDKGDNGERFHFRLPIFEKRVSLFLCLFDTKSDALPQASRPG